MRFCPLITAPWLVLLLAVSSALGVGEERYYGGSYDGYAEGLLLQSDPAEFASRFSGGSYDGYDDGLFLQSDPAEFAARFSGGSYDGYDDAVFLQSDPTEFAARYLGGSYDGYDDASATNQLSPFVTDPDSDLDGLVDWWEANYFNSLGMLSASGDYDVDGVEDGRELAADTAPDDDNSYFHVVTIDVTNSIAVSIASTNSRVYSMQVSTNMVDGPWWMVDGQTNVPGAANGVTTLIDTNAAPFRIYRVRVTAP